MQIYVIRPAKYNYKIKGNSLYDSYNHLATINDNVALKIDKTKIKCIQQVLGSSPDQIVSGTLKRSFETAVMLQDSFGLNKKLETSPYFNEIQYDMQEIISKEGFEDLGKSATNKTRQLFIKKLINNQLTEPFDKVVHRAKQAIILLLRLQANHVIVVSNSFFMKVLEYVVYCHINKQEVVAELFPRFYDGSKLAYDFLDGFSFRLEKGIIYTEGVI